MEFEKLWYCHENLKYLWKIVIDISLILCSRLGLCYYYRYFYKSSWQMGYCRSLVFIFEYPDCERGVRAKGVVFSLALSDYYS